MSAGSGGTEWVPDTRSTRKVQHETPSFRQVFFKVANVSQLRRPGYGCRPDGASAPSHRGADPRLYPAEPRGDYRVGHPPPGVAGRGRSARSGGRACPGESGTERRRGDSDCRQSEWRRDHCRVFRLSVRLLQEGGAVDPKPSEERRQHSLRVQGISGLGHRLVMRLPAQAGKVV